MKRLDRLRRLSAAQARIQALEEASLVVTEGRLASAREAWAQLAGALGASAGSLDAATLARLVPPARLQGRVGELMRAVEVQKAATLHARRRSRQIEHLLGEERDAVEREREAAATAELLDRIAVARTRA